MIAFGVLFVGFFVSQPCFIRRPMTDDLLQQYRAQGATKMPMFKDPSEWAVDQVTNFSYLFVGSNMTSNISHWDVSNGLYFDGMFLGATKFNHTLLSWDFSNAETFSRFLEGAVEYNQSLEIIAPNAVDFSFLLKGAVSYNAPLRVVGGTANITYEGMLQDAVLFNSELHVSPLSTATSVANMFENASKFNQLLDWTDLSVSADVSRVLFQADAFEWSLGCWPVNISSCSNASACVNCIPNIPPSDARDTTVIITVFVLVAASVFSVVA